MNSRSVESFIKQIMWVGSLFAASLMVGLPIVDANHYQDALRDLRGQPLSCEHDGAIDQVAAIIFLSAGISFENNRTQIPQAEKRRLEGAAMTYSTLEYLDIPPQLIILAMGPEDPNLNYNVVRNYMSREYGKLNPREYIPEELFHIIHVKNTRSSMDEARQLIAQMGLNGSVVIVTSEAHMDRALFDACTSGLDDVITVTAEQMIRLFDPEQYQAMVVNSQTPIYKRHALLEDIKRAIGYLVPNQLGLHKFPYAP